MSQILASAPVSKSSREKKKRPLGFAPSRRSRGCSAALPASVGSEHHIYAERLILSGWVDCPSCGCRISYLKIRWLGWSSQKKWIIDDNWMAAINHWISMIFHDIWWQVKHSAFENDRPGWTSGSRESETRIEKVTVGVGKWLPKMAVQVLRPYKRHVSSC